MLSIHQVVPSFSLLDQHDVLRTNEEFKGIPWVLYFYPKDDTPGCTKEACTIAEVYDDFAKLGVAVVGVSKDTPASHRKFASKYHLPFILLSDPTMGMMKTYGAFKEKSMYGKLVRGTNRITYIIDAEGKVAKVYPDVDPASHALELLKDIRALGLGK